MSVVCFNIWIRFLNLFPNTKYLYYKAYKAQIVNILYFQIIPLLLNVPHSCIPQSVRCSVGMKLVFFINLYPACLCLCCSGAKGPLGLLSVPSHGELNHAPSRTSHTASDGYYGLEGDLKGLHILWLSRDSVTSPIILYVLHIFDAAVKSRQPLKLYILILEKSIRFINILILIC